MKQIHASIEEETINEIESISKKEGRTFSQTVKILLEKAIKVEDQEIGKKK